jgi:hypothetical protein
VTSVRLIEEKNSLKNGGGPKRRVKLVTSGTDKYMWIREAKNEVFEIVRFEQFNERVLAMDITQDCAYILTVHDRFM